MKRAYEKNSTEIRITNKVKKLHPVVERIAHNLSEIDVIQVIRVSPDLLMASNDTSGGRQKNPVTKPDHPTATGVALIIDFDYMTIQFYEMNSVVKGCGEKMVQAVLNGLPDKWHVIVMMDWSGGFWDRMMEKYERIEMV